MELTRRNLLIGTLAGGGLALGYMLRPRSFPLPLEARVGETAFDAWLKIAANGMISVAVPHLEMGQGITTLIPQIVAHELGADWRQIAVEPTPISPHYANTVLAARWAEMWMPVFPSLASDPEDPLTRRWAEENAFMITADGTSIAACEGPARAAAASARALLAKAAAARWDVDWRACTAASGFISHGKQRAAFGTLAAEAASYNPPDPPELRPDPAFERAADAPPGAPLAYPRLDAPAKVDGSFRFAADVRLPDMVFAAIRHAPIGDSELTGFDRAAAKDMSGLIAVVRNKRWLAAVASDSWAAERALAAMVPRFEATQRASSEAIATALDKGLRFGTPSRMVSQGDPEKYLSADYSLALRYDVAPALHASLETASATARITDGRLELWIASQAPEAARIAAAKALDINPRDVVIYPMPAGGSFDARLDHDHAVEAALIARAAKRPVQLAWTRWQEHVAVRPRTPVSAFLAARTAPGGEVVGWKARLALPATAREVGRRLFHGDTPRQAMNASAGKADALACEGAVPPYGIEHVAVDHVPVAIGLPTGRLRGNAHGYTAFFNESFIDELARKAGKEPLSYRMAMLGQDVRLAECLQRVAALAGWGGGADSSGQGLACHKLGGGGLAEGRIAAIATARRDESGIRVDRLSAVVDIGRVINLDIARQQIEGGLIFGMGLALGSAAEYAQGLPLHGRLGALGLPRLADCPLIEVDFIDSTADPADPGELGVAVAAPAIANALYSASGLRFRRLPFFAEEL